MALPMDMGVFLPREAERKVGEAALRSHAAQRRGVESVNAGDKGRREGNAHPWKETLLATRRSEGWKGRVGKARVRNQEEPAQWFRRITEP